ncbi:MAG: O-methyltransferase [Myxococcales bacterium]|nr:O-methyltransferase [Myxococcales bacterium]
MAVIAEDVAEWLKGVAQVSGDAILDEMHALAKQRGFPIIGPEVGRLVAQLTTLGGAKRIFELGSGFGYSTLWFARAAGVGAEIFHTDGDPANTALARDFLERAGVAERVRFLTGDAGTHLAATAGPFDIVFCDIDKHQYPDVADLMCERVRVGGVIVVDNIVWSGRVARGDQSADTQGIRRFIARMWGDARFLSSLMPVRDGVSLHVRLA